jgi:hypothetical protein
MTLFRETLEAALIAFLFTLPVWAGIALDLL